MKARKEMNPFEGLNLTEAQKTQLAQLREKQREQRKANKANKADKANKDTNNATKKANRDARVAERKAARQQYLAEVKSIIGADNYVKFLENQMLNGGPRHKKSNKNFANQGKKERKGHDKGQRKGHQPRNAKPQSNAWLDLRNSFYKQLW